VRTKNNVKSPLKGGKKKGIKMILGLNVHPLPFKGELERDFV
jgi:hypothetical protein